MKKRFYVGILVTLLTLILTSCGGSSTTGTAGSSTVTINWWHIATADPAKSAWQNLANQYMKAHPNVKIVITILENDAYKNKLTTVMQSGSPPDIFHSWGGGVLYQYAKAGLVKDLTSDMQGDWGNSFNKSALNVYSDNGKVYGAPWDMGAVGIWYNKALFAKANIAQPPTTWTEFLQDVQKLKSAGITPIAIGEKEKWPGHFWWVYLAIRMGGKDAFNKAYTRTGSFADPPFVEAGKHLQELLALDPFQKGFLGSSYPDEQALMGDGKAAMELQGQWAPANDQSAAADKKGPQLGFFPFPAVEGGAGNPTDVLGGGGGYALGKNAPPEAVDFLKFVTTVQNQRDLAKQGVVLPVVKGAEDGVTDPLKQAVVQTVSKASYFQLFYDQYLPPSLAQVVLDATQGIFAKTTTPEAGAKAIEDGAATALH